MNLTATGQLNKEIESSHQGACCSCHDHAHEHVHSHEHVHEHDHSCNHPHDHTCEHESSTNILTALHALIHMGEAVVVGILM